MANGPQMDYGMSTMPAEGFSTGAGCSDGSVRPGPTNYVPWWHRAFVWSYWKCHGLPSPWCPPGNLTLHIPYCPAPGARTTTSARTIGSTFLTSRRKPPTTTAIRGTRTTTAWSSTDCTTGCDSRRTPRSATRTTETPTRGAMVPARRRLALTAGLSRLRSRKAQDRPGHSRRTRAGGAGTRRTARRRHHRPPDRNSWTSGRSPRPVPARSE